MVYLNKFSGCLATDLNYFNQEALTQGNNENFYGNKCRKLCGFAKPGDFDHLVTFINIFLFFYVLY